MEHSERLENFGASNYKLDETNIGDESPSEIGSLN